MNDEKTVTESETLTLQEVMTIMGVGENWAREIIADENFPSIRVGNRTIIPRKAFYVWFYDPDRIIRFKAAKRTVAS